ncbi:MAG: hypothetical protein K6U89_01840 [Chloroflexi bacterium]|nr:hypothetical protein [Chloroflexota bacterium]
MSPILNKINSLCQVMLEYCIMAWHGDRAKQARQVASRPRQQRGALMYLSRLSFSVLPGKGREAAEALKTLAALVAAHGGGPTRILQAHFASPEAADLQFEQEVASVAELEAQVRQIAALPEFQQWSASFSLLLSRTPKREVFTVVAEEGGGHPGPAAAASAG